MTSENQLSDVHTYLCHNGVTLLGGNGHPVRLTEACNQSWKPQGPVGLLWVHWVSLWVRFLQTIDGIRNKLSHVHTYLCHDCTDQPIHLQAEIGIVVAGQNVAK